MRKTRSTSPAADITEAGKRLVSNGSPLRPTNINPQPLAKATENAGMTEGALTDEDSLHPGSQPPLLGVALATVDTAAEKIGISVSLGIQKARKKAAPSSAKAANGRPKIALAWQVIIFLAILIPETAGSQLSLKRLLNLNEQLTMAIALTLGSALALATLMLGTMAAESDSRRARRGVVIGLCATLAAFAASASVLRAADMQAKSSNNTLSEVLTDPAHTPQASADAQSAVDSAVNLANFASVCVFATIMLFVFLLGVLAEMKIATDAGQTALRLTKKTQTQRIKDNATTAAHLAQIDALLAMATQLTHVRHSIFCAYWAGWSQTANTNAKERLAINPPVYTEAAEPTWLAAAQREAITLKTHMVDPAPALALHQDTPADLAWQPRKVITLPTPHHTSSPSTL